MSVTYLGNMNLLSAVPGIGTAIGGLQKTISQLDLFKLDKTSAIDRALVDVEAMFNVFNQARTLLEAGQSLLGQAEEVLSEARNISANLLTSVGGAGVGLYRFDGDISTIGADLQSSMRAHGQAGTVTALILVASDGGAVTAMRTLFRMD